MTAPIITATGLTTAVGIGSGPACAAMRAGINGFTELPYFDNDWRAVIGAPVPPLEWSLSAIERLAALLRSAVEQLGEQPEVRERLALIFTGSELDRPVVDEGRAQWLAQVAAQALGVSPRPLVALRGGAPAGFRALALAGELLSAGEVSAVVVCSVESLLDARSLLWLSGARPLRTTRRFDGVIPGEAAVALLLRLADGRTRGLSVAGIGFGDEPSDHSVEVPLRADGLVTATRGALDQAGLAMHDIGVRLANGAHGSSEAKEHMLVVTRLLRERMDSFPLWLCAETLGDIGTAAGLVEVAWAHESGLRGSLPGGSALATAAARDGTRGAAILRWIGDASC